MSNGLSDKEVRNIRESVRGLRIHAFTYGAVNLGLFFINMLTSFGTWWFVFPLLGWGIGLAAHAFVVLEPGFGQNWEDKMVERISQKRAEQKAQGRTLQEPAAIAARSDPSEDNEPGEDDGRTA